MTRVHRITLLLLVSYALAGIAFLYLVFFRPLQFPLPMAYCTAAFAALCLLGGVREFGWQQTLFMTIGVAVASLVFGLVIPLIPLIWLLTGTLLPPSAAQWSRSRRFAMGVVRFVALFTVGVTVWDPELSGWRVGRGDPPALEVRQLEKGDHLVVLRSRYTHHGIYCGDGTVVHYMRQAAGLVIERTPLAAFSRGGVVMVSLDGPGPVPDTTVALAVSRLGERSYDLFTNNCEHFATYCKTGRSTSTQIQSLALCIGWGFGLLLVMPLAPVLGRRVVLAGRSIIAAAERQADPLPGPTMASVLDSTLISGMSSRIQLTNNPAA